MHGNKVVVGLSGGVDSSVAALLLQRDGLAVSGLFMQNWDEDGDSGCRADEDRRDAVAVAARLGLPLHLRNFSVEYRERVFAHFLAEYGRGRTPNPDILCNREIKFGVFLAEAHALGADGIATGHYARSEQRDGRWRLLRGRDRNKDQSYFLHAIGQDALAATRFPLGDLDKDAVRRLAREAGLPTHAKPDSTGICFIGERDFRSFLAQWLPARTGEIHDVDGRVIGEHAGVFYYTLGQRGGLGIGGQRGAAEAPWYVVGKDVHANVLYAAQGNASPWLESRRLVATAPSWIGGAPSASAAFRCEAQVRHRQPPQACTVQRTASGLEVEFAAPQRAVAPGQSVVFYQGDECLGGAVIAATDAAFGGLEANLERGFQHA